MTTLLFWCLVSLYVITDDDADNDGNDSENDKANEETNPTLLPRSTGRLDCVSSMFQTATEQRSNYHKTPR